MSYTVKENAKAGTGSGLGRSTERVDSEVAGNSNTRVTGKYAILSRMPNGDPPALTLWGCEDDERPRC